jgi:acetyl coenzyme A synthetase (ADP forming)-like protein
MTADVGGPPGRLTVGARDGTDVLLADGSAVRVVLIESGDVEATARFFHQLSSDDAELWDLHASTSPAVHRVDALVASAGPDHVTVLAERHGEAVSLAHYCRRAGHDEAGAALLVLDALRCVDLEAAMLEQLESEARTHGIRRLHTDVPARCALLLGSFADLGFTPVSVLDHVVRLMMSVASTQEALEAADRRDAVAVAASMRRLLRPKSIAVIGASRRPGTIGHELVRNLVGTGFQGPVYPVNPLADHVASVPCWPAVGAVPEPVDLAVIAVPARAVADVVEECGRAGVGALVVVSSGFAESGRAGEVSQARCVRLVHDYGMRMVGPNCFGILNTSPDVSMNATFAADVPVQGTVGFASQSGGLGIAILAEAMGRDLGLSSFVSLGNKADISGNDLLTWWEQDDETDVILLYLESFGNARKFARIASRVGRRKPIVVVKSGRSRAGRRAASSHTAALATPERAVDALFHKAGVVRVDTVEELFDTAEVLAHQPLPVGRNVVVLTNSGGPGVLAADASSGHGLDVVELSVATQDALLAITPTAGGVSNPVDLGASGSAESYERSLGVILADHDVDAVVVVFTPPLVTAVDDVAHAIVRASDASAPDRPKPVVASLLGTSRGREILRSARRPIPCFTYPEAAVRAVAHVAAYAAWRSQPASTVPEISRIHVAEARRIATGAADEAGWITARSALDVLAAFGIPTAPTTEVADATAAGRAADQLGYPVALKAAGAGIVHKTDIGGVRLGLTSRREVRAAFDSMREVIGMKMTAAIVQSMAGPGVETLVGAVQDEAFGPQVLFGMGGTAVELLGDHVVRLAPLSEADARGMVLGLRGTPLLTGYRGSSPVDVDALVDVLLRVGRLAEDIPELAEMDANPVIATPDGAVVVDARLRIALPVRHPG